jgi:phosphate transport system substrate-binding protein
MPKIGMLARISLALTAVALAAVAVTATGAGAASTKQSSTSLSGAGSTFVAPLVSAWVNPVSSALSINLSYNAIGSGGGISAITSRTVDFGASDAPLTPKQFTACNGCIQIPWALAGTAVIYRVDGASSKHIKLTGSIVAQIYLGKITFWDNAAIKKLNKGVTIPHTAITVVHRSDGSGTTYNFTDFLSKVSKTWKTQVGVGTAVSWPTGEGEAHSSGVAGAVSSTNGAIGYTDADYALVNHLAYAQIQNRAGKFVLPTLATIKAASLLDTHPKADGSLSIVYPPSTGQYTNAYPISTYTYVIVATKSTKAAALKKLIGWAIIKGQSYGRSILFVPIVKSIVTFDNKQIAKIHT